MRVAAAATRVAKANEGNWRGSFTGDDLKRFSPRAASEPPRACSFHAMHVLLRRADHHLEIPAREARERALDE